MAEKLALRERTVEERLADLEARFAAVEKKTKEYAVEQSRVFQKLNKPRADWRAVAVMAAAIVISAAFVVGVLSWMFSHRVGLH